MIIINTPDPPDVEQTKLLIGRQVPLNYSGEVMLEPKKKKAYDYQQSWVCKVFVEQNKIHRKQYPAYILYRNRIIEKECYLENNSFHRDVGPANLRYAGYGHKLILNEQYYEHGLMHRLDGPAVIYNRLCFNDGKNPTLITMQEHYYINGYRHRLDGPALIQKGEGNSSNIESYFVNGQLHNESGFAERWFNEKGISTYESYALYGNKMSKEEFDKKMLTKLYW